MGIKLDERVCSRLVWLRKDRLLSQEELRQKAKVSLRTIQNLERGQQGSFSESTLIAVCRALDIRYDLLWVDDDVWLQEIMPENAVVSEIRTGSEPPVRDEVRTESAKRKWKPKVSLIVLVSLLIIVSIMVINNRNRLFGGGEIELNVNNQMNYERNDWILHDEKIPYDVTAVGDEAWSRNIEGKVRHLVYNRLDYNKTPHLGDSIHVEYKWSWYYSGGNPVIFLSAYTEWNPDEEIRLFHDTIEGEGTRVEKFTIPPPPGLGLYSVRIFYVEAFAPVPSFYGAPEPGQVTSPTQSRHIELIIEVLP